VIFIISSYGAMYTGWAKNVPLYFCPYTFVNY